MVCERISVPIRAVGLYVPAGSAPAALHRHHAGRAGRDRRLSRARHVHRAEPRAAAPIPRFWSPRARRASSQVFKVGGAQAIAAMAYGTASIPKCDKLFGPGNAWVTAAKMLVAHDAAGAAADLPAGVTEVMVIADDDARADFVAADLLAQAEHGADAQAILVTPSAALAAAVAREVARQARSLSRAEILAQSMREMRLVVVDSLDTAFDIANDYAPEHLLLEIQRAAHAGCRECSAAGAVFLGSWSPESMGDYCSGPNHTLPTYGYAKAYSGLSLEDFQKRITVQELTPGGPQRAWATTAQILARLEGLDAHAAAVTHPPRRARRRRAHEPGRLPWRGPRS